MKGNGESVIGRFAAKRPMLYGVTVVTIIALVCGAVLGLANKYLGVTVDDVKARAILGRLMPANDFKSVDLTEKDAAGKAKYDAKDVTDLKIERVYLASGGANDGNVALLSSGKGYTKDNVKVITAFDAKKDEVLGVEPYDLPVTGGQYSAPFGPNSTFLKKFAGLTADKLKSVGTSVIPSAAVDDAYSGATKEARPTANGIAEAASNAAAFYLKYKTVFKGGELTTSPAAAAINKLYPSLNETDYPAVSDMSGYTDATDITLYVVNRIPFVEVKISDGASVMLYFGGADNALPAAGGSETVLADGAAEPADADIDAAAEKGRTFFTNNRAKLLEVKAAEKTVFDAVVVKQSPLASDMTYTPLLSAKYGGNFNASLKSGADYLWRAVGVGGVSGKEYYIVSGRGAKGYDGAFTVYILLEKTSGGYFVRQVYIASPDGGDEYSKYLDGGFYKYMGNKFNAAITADNYASVEKDDAEKEIGVDYSEHEEGTHATKSYDGIIDAVKDAIKAARETFNIA